MTKSMLFYCQTCAHEWEQDIEYSVDPGEDSSREHPGCPAEIDEIRDLPIACPECGTPIEHNMPVIRAELLDHYQDQQDEAKQRTADYIYDRMRDK